MITTCSTENDGRPSDMNKEVAEITTSRLQSSHSSVSSEDDLSFSLSIERELDALVLGDELPAFEIRLISPLGRTPSPIDTNPEDLQTPTRGPLFESDSTPNACLSSDFVTLQEINARISPPADDKGSNGDLSRCNSLETIFEGVFLNTPPRKQTNVRNCNTMRGNLFGKMITNKLNSGKENLLPNDSEIASINSPTKSRFTPLSGQLNEELRHSNV